MLIYNLHRNDQSVSISSIRNLIDCRSIPDYDLPRGVLGHPNTPAMIIPYI